MDGALAAALINGAFQLVQLGLSADEVNTHVSGWVESGMTGEQIRDALHDMREARKAEAAEELRKRGG